MTATARPVRKGGIAQLIVDLVRGDLPVTLVAWDGSRVEPADPVATVHVRSPDAVAHLVRTPGELGWARAYVSGALDVEGDLFAALDLPEALHPVRPGAADALRLARALGPAALRRVSPPAEEIRLAGGRHTRGRDAQAVSHHYDVSNAFYRLFLGPTMVYSCAVFADPEIGLEAAQTAKLDLVCRKLDLQEGQRLLDVGCGWGALLGHAASTYGVDGTGVTLARAQQEWVAGLDPPARGSLTARIQDYRDIDDGPYDAISSVGMFEHVGQDQLREYFEHLYQLLPPGGRLLNHGISAQPAGPDTVPFTWPSPLPGFLRNRLPGATRDSFLERYIFPDGELVEVGAVIAVMQSVGFEVRHVESLREHYGLTLRAWVANLEAHWDEAVAAAGATRTRIWHLYLAGSARGFETGRTNIHQVLAVRPDRGRSGMPLRPLFD